MRLKGRPNEKQTTGIFFLKDGRFDVEHISHRVPIRPFKTGTSITGLRHASWPSVISAWRKSCVTNHWLYTRQEAVTKHEGQRPAPSKTKSAHSPASLIRVPGNYWEAKGLRLRADHITRGEPNGLLKYGGITIYPKRRMARVKSSSAVPCR